MESSRRRWTHSQILLLLLSTWWLRGTQSLRSCAYRFALPLVCSNQAYLRKRPITDLILSSSLDEVTSSCSYSVLFHLAWTLSFVGTLCWWTADRCCTEPGRCHFNFLSKTFSDLCSAHKGLNTPFERQACMAVYSFSSNRSDIKRVDYLWPHNWDKLPRTS